MRAELEGSRVLLLQGPNGPFFRRVAQELEEAGAEVMKINFNAGDAFYFRGEQACEFREPFEEWPSFLAEKLKDFQPDACFLFGDCRPLHLAARPVLEEYDVNVLVFEEGYLRPDFVTIEPVGVNSRSELKLEAPDLAAVAGEPAPDVASVEHPFHWCVVHTSVYSLCLTLGAWLFPHYRHHRDLNSWRQGYLWARSWSRRHFLLKKNAPVMARLTGELSGRYFLAGLQVHNDTQIATSRFESVEDFIVEVLDSFARCARDTDYLVFKHHPGDRAYRDYSSLIERLATERDVSERVLYVHDLHLPTLLEHARGTIVINSTIGWSSLHHGTPVLALDETTYGYFGLNSSVDLNRFWVAPPAVDSERVRAAEHWLKLHNQANGSVWTPLKQAGPSGLFWPPKLPLRRIKKDPLP